MSLQFEPFISAFIAFPKLRVYMLILLSLPYIHLGLLCTFDQPCIEDLTHFFFGTLPFRYLGVPLSSKCLSIAEFEKLADKMTSEIQTWQAKHLSYAARLQLINSVLMGISSYWCQMFILPKKVISCINSICRSFLWFGTADSHKPRLVNWKAVCKPKKVGGLGIRNLYIWNQSVVGKMAWHIHMMKESLWVR